MILQIETILRRLRRLFSRTEWTVRLFGLPVFKDLGAGNEGAQGGNGDTTGLVLVQIDGLSRHELERALLLGEMPFIHSLLQQEHYRLCNLYSGLPSTTPAVQGELFYGVQAAVPAFAFVSRADGLVHRMYEPASAAAVEARLANAGEGLLHGGSAYSNVYTGGASEAHFCVSSLGWSDLISQSRPLTWLVAALLHLPMMMRAIALLVVELLLAVVDAVRGWLNGRDRRAEFKFVLSRLGINILLRDVCTLSACTDIARGLPVVHINYLGFDEQAHRRGPHTAFAHWSLKGIDRSVRQLWEAAHRAPSRHYELWVYSDHGQESSIPYVRLAGKEIHQAVHEGLVACLGDASVQVHSFDESIAARRDRARRLQPTAVFPAQMRQANVVAMGPVGHVYLGDELMASPPANCENRFAVLARWLVEHARVPAALYKDADQCVHACVPGHSLNLPDEATRLIGIAHPFLAQVSDDLMSLVNHPDAGDLVLLGSIAGHQPVTFALENGSHAGAGFLETSAFALLPDDVAVATADDQPMRPVDLRHAAQTLMGRRPAVSASGESAAPQQHVRKPGCVRVMSYNVHSCVGMDGRTSPERIARVIARYQPDIVALQEIDVRRQRSFGVHQARRIGRLLKMRSHFYPVIVEAGEAYGDAILTRLPVLQSRAGCLGKSAKRPLGEPRGVQWLTLAVNDLPVQLFNTHLGLFADERQVQVQELMSARWLDHPECQGPVILCGDFNARIGSTTMNQLMSRLTEVQSASDTRRLKTFTGRWPTICIDHILIRDVYRVVKVFVPGNQLTRVASDHLPLVVDLQLR